MSGATSSVMTTAASGIQEVKKVERKIRRSLCNERVLGMREKCAASSDVKRGVCEDQAKSSIQDLLCLSKRNRTVERERERIVARTC